MTRVLPAPHTPGPWIIQRSRTIRPNYALICGQDWHDAHLSRRQIIMDEITAQAERGWEVKAERQRERDRLAALQDGTLANHIGNMETPEAVAERERERQKHNRKAMKEIKKLVDRTTIGEHMMSVLGCALFAVCIAGGTMFVVLCIDAILKIVRAW